MKLVWKRLAFIVVVVALAGIVGLFLSREVKVEEKMEMACPGNYIFNQVNDLRNWTKWSPWAMKDSTMQYVYFGAPVGKGSGYSWVSEKLGEGNITITESIPYELIRTSMDFGKRGTATGYFKFEKNGKLLNVTWGFTTDLGGNPFMRFFANGIYKNISRDFKQGLQNLSNTYTKNERYYVPEIMVSPGYNYAGIRSTVTVEQVGVDMGNNFRELQNVLKAKGIKPAGSYISRYHKMDPATIDYEALVAIDTVFEDVRNVKFLKMPEQTVVSVEYYGRYSNLMEPHMYLQNWIKEHELTLIGTPMEIYVTTPSEKISPDHAITIVSYPIGQ